MLQIEGMRIGQRGARHGRLVGTGRFLLWAVFLMASIKLTEIFGPGEQSLDPTPTIDVLYRGLVLVACFIAATIALVTGKLRRTAFSFLPFLLWVFAVTVIRQADLTSAKQVGSYASWIFFYIAASALLDQAGDYRRLASVLVASVVLSAIGGELQYLLNFGPPIGSLWPDSPGMEFMRTHTGSGGILLDAFTPYCAAILLLSTPGLYKRHILAWVLVLWGTANILRGGLLGFCIALAWYTAVASRVDRRRILGALIVAVVIGATLFGGSIASKIGDGDDGVNTSGRLDVWPLLSSWIAEEPVLGHGPDADVKLLAASAGGHDLTAAHNELLSTGVNYGLVGIFLVWVPLLACLVRNVRASLKASHPQRASSSGATAVLLMIVVLSLTDNTLRTPGVMIIALAPAAVVAAGAKGRAVPSLLGRVFAVTRVPGRMHVGA